MKTLKTWEMLRDIREGETYESDELGYYVVCDSDGYIQYRGVAIAELTGPFLSKTWRKRQPHVIVDFAKAFAAYEKGATIRPESSSSTKYSRGTGCTFHPADIRGKWIVEGVAVYWWE